MATPNLDNLHVRLSRDIGDRVPNAAVDGKLLPIVQRTDLINRAIRFIQLTIWKMDKEGKKGIIGEYLSELITTQTITAFSNAGFAIPTDYMYFVSCQKTGTTSTNGIWLQWRDPSKKVLLDNNNDILLGGAFTILGKKLYGYQNGAILNSGTGLLYYVKSDIGIQGTTDVSIGLLWHDAIVQIAKTYFTERPAGQMEDERFKLVLMTIG